MMARVAARRMKPRATPRDATASTVAPRRGISSRGGYRALKRHRALKRPATIGGRSATAEHRPVTESRPVAESLRDPDLIAILGTQSEDPLIRFGGGQNRSEAWIANGNAQYGLLSQIPSFAWE